MYTVYTYKCMVLANPRYEVCSTNEGRAGLTTSNVACGGIVVLVQLVEFVAFIGLYFLFVLVQLVELYWSSL